MLLDDFLSLNRTYQHDVLLEVGVLLGSREHSTYSVSISQISYFYVEVWYDKKQKETTHLEISADTHILEPYLDDIDIAPILLLLS
jgi:hypothetical protein